MPTPVCAECGRERTASDVRDYTPIQFITGQPLGWYSGSDGEFCGDCIAAIIANQ